MTREQHIGDDLLLAYGAGTLDEATSLLVATHLALCPACRNDLHLAESIGGALLDCAEADFSPAETVPEFDSGDEAGLRDSVDAPDPRASSGSFVLPRPLRDYAGGDAADLRWRAVGGGIRQFPLSLRGEGSVARLLSIPAGKGVPDHGHRGFEATLVLAGAFYDRGLWYRRGDVSTADEAVVHRPVAGPEEDCICLAVTDARLHFLSPIPRLLQPFHGI